MVLTLLRRSRLVAALLFAASPAIGGTVLPAVHPCPVDAPWLAVHAPAGHAGHHGGHDAPAGDRHNETCHCIGSGLSGTAVAPPDAPVQLRSIVTGFTAPALPSGDSSLLLDPPGALLPFSTAPPVV